MQFTTRLREGVTIADLSGKLTAGGGDAVFRTQVRALLDGGVRQILLDMTGLQMMDSSGLGELTGAQNAAQAIGGRIKLLHVGAGVQHVLEAAGLWRQFETFESEATAVASFRP